MRNSAPLRVRNARRTGFAAWAALVVLQVAWYAWLAPPAHTSMAAALCLSVLPWLLPLLALRRPSRALLWAGIIALFYFCHGVSEAWSAPAVRLLACIEIALCVLLIGALGAGVQRQSRTTAARPAPGSGDRAS